MKHLKSIYEYYDSFYARTKGYETSKKVVHRVATKKGYFYNLFKSISPEDKELIEWYRDGGYRHIADYLYQGKENKDWWIDHFNPSVGSLKDCIIKLDNILENTKIKKDVVLWKGMRNDSPLLKIISNMKTGDKYTFENFFSTSLNFQYALFAFGYDSLSSSGQMFKINTPAGTKGTYISHDMVENEVLLQRGQTIEFKETYEYDIGKHWKNHKGTKIKIYVFDVLV
jgi:hypothetical protein